MTQVPWDFDRALIASGRAALEQEEAEDAVKVAGSAYAEAERSYRVRLAFKIWDLRNEAKVAWSVAGDLARGDEEVADLKRIRDEAETELVVAKHAVFRRSADRSDTEGFIDWSKRRDLAEGYAPRTGNGPTFGARAA